MVGMVKVGTPISLDRVASSRILGVSTFVIFYLHQKIQKMVCKDIIVGYHPMGASTCLSKHEVGKSSQNAAQLRAKAEDCVHNNNVFCIPHIFSSLSFQICILGSNFLCHLLYRHVRRLFKWDFFVQLCTS